MPPEFTGVGMVSIPSAPTVGDRVEPAHLLYLYELCVTIIRKLNGKLSEVGSGGDGTQAGNLDAEILDAFFATADVEVALPHDLGRVPQGYVVIRADLATDIYDSNNASWTEKVLFLKSSEAGVNVKLRVF